MRVCSQQGGCPGGAYTPDDSSTYSLVLQGAFQIQYGDGTGETGDFFSDTVTIGEIKIPADIMSIGLANEVMDGPQLANDGQGLVGVGYRANFAGIESLATDTYIPPTVVTAMVQSGDIEREAYSLWLDSQNDGVGSIIFGGVDPTKYSGDLVALQTLQSYNGIANYTAFYVALTGISVKDESGTTLLTGSDFAVPALLDSGTTLQMLPTDVYNTISGGFGVTEGYVPCGYRNSNAALIYHFGGQGGPSIEVPLSALTDLPGTSQQDSSYFDDGTEACYFNMISSSDEVILGDSFMRSGYFFYDLENNLVAVAQGKAAVETEAITAIQSGTSIPGCSSTNTLTLAPTAAATTLPPDSKPTSAAGGSVLPGTPSFSLGSATGSGAAGGASSTGGSSGNGAPSLQLSSSAFAFVASLAVLVAIM